VAERGWKAPCGRPSQPGFLKASAAARPIQGESCLGKEAGARSATLLLLASLWASSWASSAASFPFQLIGLQVLVNP
jgi:hypothetical protein